MARTKGSGWGGGIIFWQYCPACNKKKAFYNPIQGLKPFKCTKCKIRFVSNELKSKTHY